MRCTYKIAFGVLFFVTWKYCSVLKHCTKCGITYDSVINENKTLTNPANTEILHYYQILKITIFCILGFCIVYIAERRSCVRSVISFQYCTYLSRLLYYSILNCRLICFAALSLVVSISQEVYYFRCGAILLLEYIEFIFC